MLLGATPLAALYWTLGGTLSSGTPLSIGASPLRRLPLCRRLGEPAHSRQGRHHRTLLHERMKAQGAPANVGCADAAACANLLTGEAKVGIPSLATKASSTQLDRYCQ